MRLLLDLSVADGQRVRMASEQRIPTGGTFGSYRYRGEQVVLGSTAAFTLKIAPRRPFAEEAAVIAGWYDQMLGRIRSALTLVRREADYLHRLDPRRYTKI